MTRLVTLRVTMAKQAEMTGKSFFDQKAAGVGESGF